MSVSSAQRARPVIAENCVSCAVMAALATGVVHLRWKGTVSMSTYKGSMTIYNGYGGSLTKVKAIHTTTDGTNQELSASSLAAGAAATAVAIAAFSDQDDSWALSFVDGDGNKKSVGFDACGFKSEDDGGTVIFNISASAVKLCFPQSDDELADL